MYSLEKDENTFTFVSFSFRQVYKDQLKLKGETLQHYPVLPSD